MRLAVCMLVAWVTVAHADDRKVAEVHFHAGEQAYAAQNFEAAATNFELAYQAMPLPEIAFAVAQAYRRWYRIDPSLERAKKSVDHYRYYLDKVKTGGKVGVAADGLGEMQRESDKLTAAGAKAAAAVVVVSKHLPRARRHGRHGSVQRRTHDGVVCNSQFTALGRIRCARHNVDRAHPRLGWWMRERELAHRRA